MAGDWIPMRIDLAEDPAVMEMAEALEMPEPYVVGCLHAIWSWASRQCNAGSVTGVTVESLGRVTGCVQVAREMLNVGWLVQVEVDGKQVIQFPKWDRWMSQSAKARALTAKRVARMRNEKCNGVSVTESLLEKRREEKSTEEKKKTPLPPFVFPSELDTEEFRTAWANWKQHRKDIRKPLTPASIAAQMKQFSGWGVARSVAAIEHTICKGWQGIREGDTKPTSKPTTDRVGAILARTQGHANTS
jgi:hypothetical protein